MNIGNMTPIHGSSWRINFRYKNPDEQFFHDLKGNNDLSQLSFMVQGYSYQYNSHNSNVCKIELNFYFVEDEEGSKQFRMLITMPDKIQMNLQMLSAQGNLIPAYNTVIDITTIKSMKHAGSYGLFDRYNSTTIVFEGSIVHLIN